MSHLNLKYLYFVSLRGAFRHAGTDVTYYYSTGCAIKDWGPQPYYRDYNGGCMEDGHRSSCLRGFYDTISSTTALLFLDIYKGSSSYVNKQVLCRLTF